jgi:peroxiredoxin
MKLNYILLLFISLILSASQCGNSVQGTMVKGTITGAEALSVYFDQIGIDNLNTVMAQGNADGSGNFNFSFPEGLEAGTYRVRFGAKFAYLVFDGSEKEVTVTGELNSLDRYQIDVQGSALSQAYVKAMQDYLGKKMQIADIQKFVNEGDPLVGMQFAMSTLGPRPDFAAIHSTISKRLSEQYPDTPYSIGYAKIANDLSKQLAMRNAQAKIKVGEIAPDIALPNPDGTEMALSDLKGKVVLLDFWASWCGPCRKANPHVVETYHKYKDQGFTVYSVSLDGLDARTKARFKKAEDIDRQMKSSMDRWKAAIAKDQLAWDSHVSDLKKWDSAPAAIYGVRSIPKTFLIDRDGKIAALNPRYNLEEELLKLL